MNCENSIMYCFEQLDFVHDGAVSRVVGYLKHILHLFYHELHYTVNLTRVVLKLGKLFSFTR